ncbi:MAG: phospholipase D-like domain-containing protein, partial [Gemmatimonadota bacterium]
PPLGRAGEAVAVPVVSAAGGSISQVALLYWMSLRGAEHSVRIATPYFVPDSSLVAELEAAARRGVEVTILVPGEHNDSALVRYASMVHYADLLEAGVRIFEYQPTMMHAKAVTVDEGWSVVGSSNFDNRSFDLNYEITLAIPDSGLTSRLREVYEADLAKSSEVTLEDVREWSVFERARNRLAYALREQL